MSSKTKSVCAYFRVPDGSRKSKSEIEKLTSRYSSLITSTPNWSLDRVFFDCGIGVTTDTPSLNEIRRRSHSGEIDILIVRSAGMICRLPPRVQSFVQELSLNHTIIVSEQNEYGFKEMKETQNASII